MDDHLRAVIIVVISGLVWSFGPLVVKNMTDPQLYQLPYLVIRGMTVATIIAFYLFFNEGLNFVKKLFQIDGVTIIGGMSLTTAFLGFIYSISYTTAAVTLFMLALMPFFGISHCIYFLKRKNF
jgi:drug/metabolite transporter (DMT)-like permease